MTSVPNSIGRSSDAQQHRAAPRRRGNGSRSEFAHRFAFEALPTVTARGDRMQPLCGGRPAANRDYHRRCGRELLREGIELFFNRMKAHQRESFSLVPSSSIGGRTPARCSSSATREASSVNSSERLWFSSTPAMLEASSGLMRPAAIAKTTTDSAAVTPAAVVTSGKSIVTGRPLRSGRILSMHNRIATLSPSRASSTHRRVNVSASPSRSASAAAVVTFLAPFGLPAGLPETPFTQAGLPDLPSAIVCFFTCTYIYAATAGRCLRRRPSLAPTRPHGILVLGGSLAHSGRDALQRCWRPRRD